MIKKQQAKTDESETSQSSFAPRFQYYQLKTVNFSDVEKTNIIANRNPELEFEMLGRPMYGIKIKHVMFNRF